ncbi:MAG: TetR/AcrR family transcriptional regulator [Candidatus Metalachnospira sp.]|nr:TetR/AcrR family transcriptional regulator [Candidatus Metalachnospira sp.]
MNSKKEALAQFHRNHIIEAAKELFSAKGLEGASMDELAAKAEYSKSTIYVYFSGKDDIYYSIVHDYLEMLRLGIDDCIKKNNTFEDRYYAICDLLVGFAENEQMYFDTILGKISVDEADFEKLPILKTIYETGEEINELIAQLFQTAVNSGFADENLPPIETGFVFWSSICSLISVSRNKAQYFRKNLNISRDEFLKFGFTLLLNSIRKKDIK